MLHRLCVALLLAVAAAAAPSLTPAVRTQLLAAFLQSPPTQNPDVNNDGIVDSVDVGLVRAALGKRCGQAGYSGAADVDRSCVVDVSDLAIVSRNLGKTYPSISPVVTPAPNVNGWNRTDVVVSFTCAKVASCPSPITVVAEGAGQVITGTGTDKAGKPASSSVTVNLDRTAPSILITAPLENARFANLAVAVAGTVTDNLSGLASLACNGSTVTPAGGGFACSVNISPQSGTIEIQATDRAGNTTTATRTVKLNTTPVARAGDSQAVASGALVTLDGSGSNDADGDALTFKWTLLSKPEGSAAALLNPGLSAPTFTADRVGRYAFRLIVNDGLVDSLEAGVEVTATARNGTPTATAGGPYTVTAKQLLPFSGSGTDPDNDPLTYSWSFGDGETGIGPSPSHAYDGQGSYTATLTVDDGRGGVTGATALVTVQAIVPGNRVPTVSAGGPYTTTANQPLTLNGSASDPDGDGLLYSWSFGDGDTGSGPSPVHVYHGQGTLTATLTVDDGRGGVASGTATVVVQPVVPGNLVPTAVPGGPYSGTAKQLIAFAGSGTDPDGDALAFEWSFGDGATAVGASPSHAYSGQGEYTATLAVDDGRGGVASATTKVVVQPIVPGNLVPTAVPGGPYSGTSKQLITFNGSGSDPDGDPLTYRWDFGDGHTAIGASPSYAYAGQGTFTATVTVDDGRGGSAGASAIVSVQPIVPGNRVPTAVPGGPYRGTAKQLIAFAGGGTDPDGDPLTLSWSFGDGQSAAGGAPSHAYAGQGEFVATLTADDGRGGVATATTTVIVQPIVPGNLVPTAVPGGPYSGTAKELIVFTGSGTDPDADPLVFTWNFGDGQTATGASATHAYAGQGEYTATLTVDDGRGGVSSATSLVTVRPIVPGNRVPTATAGGPYTALVGQPVTFAGSGSDPDGDALAFTWSFGDNQSGTGAAPSHTYNAPGTFTATLTADDARGGVSTSTTQVTIQPVITPDNRVPTADAGGPYSGETRVQLTFDASGSSDPDNDALTYVWDFGDGASGTGATPKHGYQSAGAFTAKVTVNDGHGGSHTATASVEVTGAPDRFPPIVKLIAPKEAFPGTIVAVTADARDNVGVSSVAFAVDGGSATALTEAPYVHQVTIPSVVAPDAAVSVLVKAIDAAGNEATATASIKILAVADTLAPSIQLTGPSGTAPGKTVVLTAIAEDNVGVSGVTFSVGGSAIETDTPPTFQLTYSVPAVATVGSTILVTARASDAAGNNAEASRSITVEGTADEVKPAANVILPPVIEPGKPLVIQINPTDANGIADVKVYVNNVLVDADPVSPYEIPLDLPPDLPLGTELDIRVVITDYAGNVTEIKPPVVLQSPPLLTKGVVTGEAFDDVAGLPLADVAVRLSGNDENGVPYTETATTDGRGRYAITANPGHVIVEFSKSNWAGARRAGEIVGGQALELLDARLTALPVQATALSVVLGGDLTTEGGGLHVPPGALASAAGLNFVTLTQQGLIVPPPAGWSPIAAVEVRASSAFVGVLTAAAAPVASVASGSSLAFAKFDPAANAWRAVDLVIAPAAGARLEHEVSTAGQYAWLLADSQPNAPPVPAGGSLVAGVATPTVPDAAATTISPQPKIIFYKPGVHSDVHNVIATSAPISSGAVVLARISETYTFFSGSTLNLEPFTEDLLFFQASPAAATVEARHRVTPSLTFEPNTLQLGVIEIALSTPAAGPRLSALFDVTAGGTVTSPFGERLTVPAGASTTNQTFTVDRLTAAQLGFQLPTDLELLDGLQVTFDGRLTRSAALSIAVPAGLTDASQVFLARLMELGGQTRLVFKALARIEGDRLVSDTAFDGTAGVLDGVREAGRYVFLRATVPTGFAAGRVSNAGAQAFANALVSSNGFALVALSAGDGKYVSPTAVGQVTLSAVDVAKFDSGSGQGLVAPPQVLALDLVIAPQLPSVVSVTPADDAANVPLGSAVVVRFSEPIDVTSAPPSPLILTGPGGSVAGTSVFSGGNTVLTFRPTAALQPNASYTVQVPATLKDLSGYALAAALETQFTSLDTIAPLPPPAGNFTATIPENGTTTVRATQGTAGRNDTVTILNVTKGTITPVLLESNGGFLTLVQAAVSDKLKVRIVDVNANEVVVDLSRFTRTNPDGSLSAFVDAGGGRLDGPNGIVVDVPAGAFAAGTIVTIGDIREQDFPIQMTTADREYLAYSGGIRLDFNGATPAVYLNVSIPADSTDGADDQWIVGGAKTIDGRVLFEMVDTARVINGRITTSSPPCPGVTAQAEYAFMKASRSVGVNYGRYSSAAGVLAAQYAVFSTIATVAASGVFGGPGMLGAMTAIATTAPLIGVLSSPVCIPVLSGRVTIAPNVTQVKIARDQLAPDDVQIQVTNMRTGQRRDLALGIGDVEISLPGRKASFYEIEIESADGRRQDLGSTDPDARTKAMFSVATFIDGTTLFKVAAAMLDVPADKVHVRQTYTRDLEGVSIDPLLGVDLTFPGGGAPEYELRVDGLLIGSGLYEVQITPTNEILLHVLPLAFTSSSKRVDFKVAQTIAFSGLPEFITVGMEGGANDSYDVRAKNRTGSSRAVSFDTVANLRGNGQLVLKVLPATIDPYKPDVGRVGVTLINTTTNQEFSVPEKLITCGGISLSSYHTDLCSRGAGLTGFTFDGELGQGYTLRVDYADGSAPTIRIPTATVTALPLGSGGVPRTISITVPPRDEPLLLPPLNDDKDAPDLLTSEEQLIGLQSDASIALNFSEPLSATSAQRGIEVTGPDG
ncbi:MAG: PKD domain-containing protein, partial [Vicinamibacterales bacterium]